MENKDIQNFTSFYDLEAQNFEGGLAQPVPSLLKFLLKATGIFMTITLIVFFISNYQYIKSQLIDWRQGQKTGENIKDVDGDGIPGWWEAEYGLDDNNKYDALYDNDNDNAINLLEYQFGTNPWDADTDGDGYTDGKEIANGYNPTGEGKIDTDKDGIPDWWEERYGLDKRNPADALDDPDGDGVSNRDEFKYSSHPREIDSDNDGVPDGEEIALGRNPAGSGSIKTSTNEDENDQDGDGLNLFLENFFGTDPNSKDTDGDGFDDKRELTRGYDPTGQGMIQATIIIPTLGVSAPLIWSQSEDEKIIQEDLAKGVIHYTGTAFPAMRGNSYLTGHSSYYSWSSSPYKTVFRDLGGLKNDDLIKINLNFANGLTREIIYKVVSNEIVDPSDQRLFREYEGYEMTLVTCWPLGTDWKRVMIKAELESPKQ